MALTSRIHGVTGRIRTATSNLHEDNQSLISDIGKAFSLMKEIAELTDFDKLFKNEVAQLKANSSSVPQNHPLMRQFREAVWKVHHAGEPMLGEEQEDIIMTSNQSTILNVTCPLSGKPVIELKHPVGSIVCKHVYDKGAITQYLRGKQLTLPCCSQLALRNCSWIK